MTIQQAQEQVDQWIRTYGGGYFSELTNLGILMEETGELSRWMVRHYGDQSFKPTEASTDIKAAIQDEIADVLWVLICLSNQMGINLTEAFDVNLEKKTSRDRFRHLRKEKD